MFNNCFKLYKKSNFIRKMFIIGNSQIPDFLCNTTWSNCQKAVKNVTS